MTVRAARFTARARCRAASGRTFEAGARVRISAANLPGVTVRIPLARRRRNAGTIRRPGRGAAVAVAAIRRGPTTVALIAHWNRSGARRQHHAPASRASRAGRGTGRNAGARGLIEIPRCRARRRRARLLPTAGRCSQVSRGQERRNEPLRLRDEHVSPNHEQTACPFAARFFSFSRNARVSLSHRSRDRRALLPIVIDSEAPSIDVSTRPNQH
jgi:hypothetical protein